MGNFLKINIFKNFISKALKCLIFEFIKIAKKKKKIV